MQGASSRVPLNPLPGGVVLLETCHIACIHRGVRQDRMLASYESMLKVIRSSRCRASYTSLEEIAVIKLQILNSPLTYLIGSQMQVRWAHYHNLWAMQTGPLKF